MAEMDVQWVIGMTKRFQKEAQYYAPFQTLKYLLQAIFPFMQTS
jgi:hypothetical protein